ncbi:uncharacterized protein LOC125075711 isoform X6 [Vanessa atalanta]|uniref:uncharacterized protein LOC125075711 isoform X6 n=1 Tax=Vanessa atalanta TaxID=42275 RepID=UPI001FCE23D3|nr:uncharacterized protein LOC125075711 isoform X6 [Vanessa atalanta]
MEGAILSTQSNNRFRTHLKNAATVLCARTLPKSRCSEQSASSSRHHTYPRTSPPKRASIPCRMEPLMCELPQASTLKQAETVQREIVSQTTSTANGVVKLKSTLAREVAHAWECRIGPPDQPAPAHRVQSLFNDIELYPTKTQVFEMLVCARQCARRKSLILTFGEFCVFAAELRRCSRQTRQTSNKPESPLWSSDKELRDKEAICKHVNGSEASPPPPCEVFLGGSCNPTTWRSDIAIPMLKKMGITYFNPQVDDWSTELIEVEHRAKAEARALLFVLDSETRAVAASVEAAHLAAAPRDLLLVLRPYSRHQNIGRETISDQEYIELSRARATLQEAVERRGLPAFTDIPAALRCARAVLRGAPRDLAERCLPANADTIDFESFCAAVAELAADAEYQSRHNSETESAESVAGVAGGVSGTERVSSAREGNGLRVHNPRLRAYGQKLSLFIPKNGSNRSAVDEGTASGGSSGDSVFTPGTERRLERLPAMLGAPIHDVYLGGSFPSNSARPDEILRREGFTCVIPRVNDYTRMFSAPARRTAPAPDSPCRDKKPRPDTRASPPASPAAPPAPPSPAAPASPDVVLRERAPDADRPCDRLSASDFYSVTEDITPQPFKGTYDEELLLGSRVLVFAMSAEAPSFAAMVLAAHYMGLRPNHTVLLVQPMDPQRAHPYSEAAVKDYNRGRHYLRDLARRAGVPVFDSVDATVACVVSRLRVAL